MSTRVKSYAVFKSRAENLRQTLDNGRFFWYYTQKGDTIALNIVEEEAKILAQECGCEVEYHNGSPEIYVDFYHEHYENAELDVYIAASVDPTKVGSYRYAKRCAIKKILEKF